MAFKTIPVSTHSRSEFLDVTAQVADVVRAAGVSEGLCVCYVPHTTAGVTINENADPSVRADMHDALARLVPEGAGYRHLEGNADSHVKASLMGASVTIPIAAGDLVLGTWQGIYFCEFDGPRSRSLHVTVIGTP